MQINQHNVLILEDNEAVAARIERVLSGWPLSKTVSVCTTIRRASELLESTKFDILLADLRLPDGSGIEIIEMLAAQDHESYSLVISALTDQKAVINALQAGAVGYLLKDDPKIQILHAIESVLAGQSPISSGIARHLVNFLSHKKPTETLAVGLTPREIEVLNHIAKGFTNNEVATILKISNQTVPVHIRNIYFKLQARNRAEATYEARRLGILVA